MKLKNISFSKIIQDFSFETTARSLAILGPSGCGKTTLFRLLCGLEDFQGEVELPSFTAAFQEPRLIPWLTAQENLSIILGEKQAELWLEKVGLVEDGKKYPAELSGGMCQRLSLARALGAPGDLLLLDEPFSGIDLGRKDELKILIRNKKKLLLITHDPEDALDLCDEILLVDGPPLKIVEYFRQTKGIEQQLEESLRRLIIKNKEVSHDTHNHQ